MKLFGAGKNRPPHRAASAGREREAAPPPSSSPAYNRRTAGNVFFALFAAVAMVGAVGYGFNTVLRGPVKSMTDVTRRTVAESTIVTSSRLAIVGATTQQTEADCDADGMVEPMPYRDAGTLPHPAGGGYLPAGLVPDSIDPWKTEFGYCAWDAGTTTVSDNVPGCGGSTAKRLNGAPSGAYSAVAIISAGQNKKFETTCNAYVDTTPADGKPDAVMLNKPAGSDDIVLGYTYAEANDLGQGMWKPVEKDVDGDGNMDDVATTRNALEGTKDASFGGAVNLKGNVLTGGGLVLPGDPGDDSLTGPCNSANDKQIRRNTSTVPPTLEICNFTSGLGWSSLSGAAASSAGGGMTGQLVSHWMLDETSGTTAADSAGTNTITLNNAPTWSSNDAIAGGSMRLTTDQIGTVADNPSLRPTAITVAGWVKLNQVIDGWGQILKKDFNGSNLSYALSLGYTTGGAPKFPNFRIARESNGGIIIVTAPNPLAVGEWTHVVGSYDPSLTDKRMKLYVNGVLVASDNTSDAIAYDASPVHLGGTPFHDKDMTLDDVRLYNYAISEVEVHNLYNTTKPPIRRSSTQAKAGYLATWGHGSYYKTGQGVTTDSPTPVVIGTDFIQASAGMAHGCAVKAGGTVWCWGNNSYGQIGNGNTIDQPTPVQVKNLTDAVKVVSGMYHSCAIRRNGEAWCWGNGTVGQLGNSNNSNSSIPVKVSNISDFVEIAENPGWVNCGIRQNGEAWCWGSNASGHFGNGVKGGASNVPVKVSNITDFAQIVIGTDNSGIVGGTCGVRKNGQAVCWGTEVNQNFGNGATSSDQLVPATVLKSGGGYWTDWVELAMGMSTCGLRANGTIWCWGDDANGSLGNGAVTTGTQNLPVQVSLFDDFVRVKGGGIASNPANFCGIRKNGDAYCWGYDALGGSLGNGAALTANQTEPSKVKGANFTDISFGAFQAAAIMDNSVRPISDTARPQQLLGGGSTNNRCVITNDRSAWCWGADTNGALGNGAVTGTRAAPSKVTGNGPWAQIVNNSATGCGIKMDGTLWCWGQNDILGLVGVGTSVASYTSPVQVVTTVPANTNPWSVLSTGFTGCAIKTDGTLWCWGSGSYGRIGDGGTSSRLSPVQIGSDKKWLRVTTSSNTTCAIATDRRLWCWGDNSKGQLGIGTAAFGDNAFPLLVPDPGPWYDVVTSGEETCGVKMDGTGWCWGYAVNTKLGNNQSTGNYPSPQLIAEPGPWRMVSPGGTNGCGLKVDGSAWCWGNNTSGVLGMGLSGGTYNYPMRVLGGNDWVEVRPSGLGNCGIKKDDSIWCWGFDTNGILGNGVFSTANLAYPTRVSTIPTRDPWMPAEHGGGLDLLPGLDAVIGITRYISNDGAANTGLQFQASGRTLLRSPGTLSQLTLETIGEPGLGVYDQDSGQMLSAGSETPSAQLRLEALSAQAAVLYANPPDAVSFDGATVLSGTMSGNIASDNDKFTMSFWFRIHNATPLTNMVVYDGNAGTTRARISLVDGMDTPNGDGLWQLRLQLEDSSTLLTAGDGMGIRTNGISQGVWHHALISVDTTNLITHLYIDDISNVRNNDKTMVAGMIDFDANQRFGNATDGLDADISEMQIDVGTYRDFSIEDNRRLFINKKGGPVAYGVWTITPYDFPDIYMVGNYSGWPDNVSGSGGPFTVTSGALTDAATTPMNATATSTTRVDRLVGTDMATGNFKIARFPLWQTDVEWLGNMDADLEVTTAGNMGIGTLGSPQAKLDVAGAIKIGNDATCTSAKDGMIVWNGTKMQFCNSGSWKDFGLYGGSTYWSSVSGGQESRCAISHSGAAYCWGQAYNGQLGDNQTATARTTPVGLHSDTSSSGWSNWIQLASARRTRCGLRSDGTAWCWGENDVGQIGNNTDGTNVLRPVQVHSSTSATGWTDWIQIITGGYYSCGLRSNGTVWCWGSWSYIGSNNNNGAYDYARRPVQVHTNTGPGGWSDWQSISGGIGAHACGIRTNGTAWCWGQVGPGAAGDGVLRGSFGTVPRPVQVQNTTGPGVWSDWKQLSAGNVFTCGIRTNGELYCWGDNQYGWLGIGTTGGTRTRPTQVRDSAGTGYWSDWVQVSAGTGGACGLRVNGTLWCWGGSLGGQLGNNQNSVDSNLPVQVHSDTSSSGWTDWVSVSANEVNCGIRADGSLWCWGNGFNGNGGTGAMRPVKVSEP